LPGHTEIEKSAGADIARRVGLFLGPILFAVLLFLNPFGLPAGKQEVLAVFCWMLAWWVTEAVPLAVTALLPMLLFPLTGVMTLDEAVVPYSNKVIYLFFGGFILALGLEEHNLHKRIALKIIGLTGVSPNRLILGFMLATAALSMWISNTATAVMMLPMAISVLNLLMRDTETSSIDPKALKRFSAALVLSIAYGANIGGMATVIGTPPNLAMRSIFSRQLGIEISFFQWMIWALPITLVLLLTVYLLFLLFVSSMNEFNVDDTKKIFDEERKILGSRTTAQTRMLLVFLITACCWMGRDLIVRLFPGLPLTDEAIALIAAISLFVIPADWQQNRSLLNWEATRRLPWGMLLLFGGGLCLADGFQRTGVLASLVDSFLHLGQGHVLLTVFLLTAIALYATEVMSNVALVNVLIPIIAAIAVKMEIAPIEFAFPATLASSCAFMLPIATPPNAIVFSSGQITVRQMVWIGFWLNLVSLAIIVSMSRWLLHWFGG
jgi:sodium-dependent dicarboxylate transporter 2/3/5